MLRALLPALLAASCISAVAAEPVLNVRDAAQKAIVTNPEVEAKWHAFRAAMNEQDVARGGYLPRVDLSAGIGRERLDAPGGSVLNYTRSGTTLSLTQMLYDGFATRSEVARLGYAKLTRYYEVLDAAESTALEAVRAYEDILRYRELMNLARENYVQHKFLFDQIMERVQAGVGRRVDLELASGRLALAESNLLTEATNLHDVSARYLRIVGETPADNLSPANLSTRNVPPAIAEALKLAYEGNPAFNAAIENIRAAKSELDGKDAPFQPRVDFRARQDLTDNYLGVEGQRTQQVVELVLSYNLYKGGSDTAAKRQYNERLNLAKDLRDKSCRDIRQTLTIAHNDITRLEEQLRYLNQHQLATSKAREAYRSQFDIGQRTLLDLLDTENEYFQAKRAYTNAQHDQIIAKARTLAGMGRLLQALEISRDTMPTLEEIGQDRVGIDPDSACPAAAPAMTAFDKQAILDEALKASGLPAKHSAPIMTLPSSTFDSGSSQIKPQSKASLDKVANTLNQDATVQINIAGHTDNVGTAAANQQLSEERASSVRNYLEERDVASSRMSITGFGSSRPIASNDTEEGRAKNRRVDITTSAP